MKYLAVAMLVPVLLLNACSTPQPTTTKKKKVSLPRSKNISLANIKAEGNAREVVMYALGLLDVDYQFGGSNPEAGLDCSGMASFIYQNALGIKLPHNAAEIAKRTREIRVEQLRAGDFVFFNTMNRSYSHMGIYLGDGKFIHAPRTNSTVRVERLDNQYFSARFDGARTLFD